MDLRGNVALVTGAAGPIGAAVSVRLAGLGASVAVLDRRPDAVAERIVGTGGHVLALTADVADQHSVRAAVGRLLTAWERIDIVVIGAEALGTVGPAVAGFLPEAARTSPRAVADLVVLAGSVEPAGMGWSQRLADQQVRLDVLAVSDGLPVEDLCGQVLALICRPCRPPVVPVRA